jgi:glycosyltransferase involved in cell wall biosynthesis
MLSNLNRHRLRLSRSRRRGYSSWIKQYEKPFMEKAAMEFLESDACVDGPLITVLMPVYNAKLEYLKAAIESVRNQSYVNWELAIADDCSTSSEVVGLLKEYEKIDSRIKVVFRTVNGHISQASNSALSISSGEYVALLDQDDLLPEHALGLVSDAIKKNPGVSIIYSDEDKFEDDGCRYDPYFKPGWNLYLFRSHNMISHLGVYSRSVLDDVGGFRVGYEGSQDYDLALRCLDHIDDCSRQIVHIPHVLYHWRVHPESTAASIESKPYAMYAAQRALQDHLSRFGVSGDVSLLGSGSYRTVYRVASPKPRVSVLLDISTLNIERLVSNIDIFVKTTDYPNYEIVLACPTAFDAVKTIVDCDVKLMVGSNASNVFDSLSVERFFKSSEDVDFICFLKASEPVSPAWLDEMVGIALQQDVGMVSGTILNADQYVVNAGYVVGGANVFFPRYMGKKKTGIFSSLVQQIAAGSSMCMLINRGMYFDVGGFTKENVNMDLKSVDLSLRVSSLGKSIVWSPFAEFVLDIPRPLLRQKAARLNRRTLGESEFFRRAWSNVAMDRYFNPNYRIGSQSYELDAKKKPGT